MSTQRDKMLIENFKNAKEYWTALTKGHDFKRIEDTNEFWNDMDTEEIDNLEEVNNQRGLYEEYDEYVTYIALKVNDEKFINNNCFKIYYSHERHYYIITQLFLEIAAEDMHFEELDLLEEDERY